MKTIIKAKQDLYNVGKCFTKGKTYVVHKRITTEASLMETKVMNDNDELHNIGSWWREFEIVRHDGEYPNGPEGDR
jgi:hypothetical protein